MIDAFPARTVHAERMKALGLARGDIISAGFVARDGACGGWSSSLNIESRPVEDTALFRRGGRRRT